MGRILIVDDENDLTELLSFYVHQLNIKTLVANSGNEAWQLCQSHGDIVLVIADVRMPKGDGVDLLKRIKGTFPQMPVILISGFADVSEKEALQLGAKALLSKPMDLSRVQDVIKRFLP